MARNMYGATSADFTLTSGGRPVPGSVLTLYTARTGGVQITDLLDVNSAACTTVTSGADGSVVYYGPNNDKTVHWADSGQGARVAIRPTDITGDPPVMSIGTVGTGTAAASLTGTSEAPVLNLTLPSAGANGVDTAAIQSKAVTAAKIADDTITAAQIAANAVGSSELADNAVDTAVLAASSVTTAKIADSAVTSAKIADGTITATDVAAGTFAAFSTVGNLLTANQSSGTDTLGDTTGFLAWNACTISSSANVAKQGAKSLRVVVTGGAPSAGTTQTIPVTAGQTYTAHVNVYATEGSITGELAVLWWTSGGALISQVSVDTVSIPAEDNYMLEGTVTAPATAAFAALVVGGGFTSDYYLDEWGLWKGAGGQWAMPGVPIVGGSHIATNGAVHLSGTGTPEGVITAAPGSTWLQTDSTVDVKGWIRWVKATGTGNTGWIAGPEANTGWRKIVAWNSSGTITYGTATWGTNWAHAAAGALALRRAGDLTFLRMNYVRAVTTNPGTAIFNEWTTLVPEAFRPAQPLTPVLGSGLSAYLPVDTGIMANIAANSYTVVSDFVGQCYGAAWPASLPGTAV